MSDAEMDIERPWTDMGDLWPDTWPAEVPVQQRAETPTQQEIDWTPAIEMSRVAAEMYGLTAEACGYIVSGRVVLCTNVARETGLFAFSDADSMAVYAALEQGTLDGIWHSHPLGHDRPSAYDWNGHPRGVSMYIVVLDQGWIDARVLLFDDSDRVQDA